MAGSTLVTGFAHILGLSRVAILANNGVLFSSRAR